MRKCVCGGGVKSKKLFYLEKVDINTGKVTNYLITFQECECLNKMPVFPSTLVVSEYILSLQIAQDLNNHQKENASFLFLICEREIIFFKESKKESIRYLSFMSCSEFQKKSGLQYTISFYFHLHDN